MFVRLINGFFLGGWIYGCIGWIDEWVSGIDEWYRWMGKMNGIVSVMG